MPVAVLLATDFSRFDEKRESFEPPERNLPYNRQRATQSKAAMWIAFYTVLSRIESGEMLLYSGAIRSSLPHNSAPDGKSNGRPDQGHSESSWRDVTPE
jgi:hypothetical protein